MKRSDGGLPGPRPSGTEQAEGHHGNAIGTSVGVPTRREHDEVGHLVAEPLAEPQQVLDIGGSHIGT